MAEKTNSSTIFFRCLAKVVDLFIVITLFKLIPSAGLYIGILYILLGDGIFRGKSIGKKLLRVKVHNLQSQRHGDFRDSIVRNLPIGVALFFFKVPIVGWLIGGAILAFELILIIGDTEGRRLGDRLANTTVLEE